MKKLFLVIAFAVSVSLILQRERVVQSAATSAPRTTPPPAIATKPRLSQSYAQLPLRFEANQGQTDGQVNFLARGPGYSLFLTATGAVLRMQTSNCEVPEACQPVESILRMNLAGAQTPTLIAGRGEQVGKSNYFVGNDPQQWRTQVPNYEKVEYKNIYPGIDLVYYGQQQQLEYDFIIAPKANPRAIKLDFQGAQALGIAANGDLVLRLANGEVRLHKPVAYQLINGQRHRVEATYRMNAKRSVSFHLGAYDRTQPLVIDPVLVYSTYLGGTASETGRAIAVDKDGNAYIVGETSSNDFPGASQIQPNRGNVTEAFVLKLNATGSQVVYATWLGGDSDDQARNVAVDGEGNAYVVGATASSNFPITNGALQRTRSGDGDAFVAKLNPTGSALLYSTLLGGNGSETALDLAVDANGNAYIAGSTFSTDLPATGLQTARRGNSIYKSTNQAGSWAGSQGLTTGLTNSLTIDPTDPNTLYAATIGGAYKSTNGGTQWQRLAPFANFSLNTYNVAIHPTTPTTLYAGAAGALFKSTDGGASWGQQLVPLIGTPLFFSVVIDPATPSTVYTGTAAGVYKTTNNGNTWAAANNGLGQFPGPSNPPQVNRLVIDRNTPATLYAATNRGFFKTVDSGASWVRSQQGLAGGGDANVRDLIVDPTTPTTMYAMVIGFGAGLYKTTDGAATWSLVTNGISLTSGAPPAQIVGLAIEPATPTTLYAFIPNGGVFKSTNSGATWNIVNNGLNNLQVSAITVDRNGVLYVATNSGSDGFVAKLNPTGSALGYLTYLGGDESDTATGITVDKDGNALVTGVTSARNFPTMNPFQANSGGGADAFVAKLNGAGSALQWSTYLGGVGTDSATDIALNANGQAYVTGVTNAANFPTMNPLQATNKGLNEIFVTKFRADGSGLEFSTYLGGTRTDGANGIALDADGNVYLTGSTESQDFPLADAVQTVLGSGTADAFVIKLNAAGSALVYSTYLGGSGTDMGFGIAVDSLNQAYITGFTASQNFPTVNSLQPLTGGSDLFIAKLGIESDLAITQSQVRNPVMVNNNHTYTITATNNGPSPATGVKVIDVLPAGVNFVSATPSQGSCTHNGGTVTCNLGDVDKQKSATITLTVTPTVVGKINHRPTISGTEPDSNQANNTSVLETTVSNLPSIGGRVTDASNKGLAGVTLTLSGSHSATALTDNDGYYQIAELPRGGNYTLVASKENYSFEPPVYSYINLNADQTANFAATVCSYLIYPTAQDFGQAGGAGSLSILATARCPWTVAVNAEAASWLKITSNTIGSGNGAVTFTVAPTTVARSGRITVAGQTFVVYQSVATCSVPSFGIKTYFQANQAGEIKTADFDGDGKQDMAMALRSPVFDEGQSSFALPLRILASDSNGGFRELATLKTAAPFSQGPAPFVVGDFNGDQKPDIVLYGLLRRIELYLNDGKGNFRAPTFSSPAIAPSFVGDVNRDGKLDLLAASGPGVTIMLNQGEGFGVPYEIILNGAVKDVADFTGDGVADVLTLGSGFNFEDQTLMVYPGDGIGSFKRAVNTPITAFPSSLVTADFNGDGGLDIGYLTTQYLNGILTKSQLIMRMNDGTGKFAAATTTIDLSLTNTPLALAVADFNGDAKPDAVITNLRRTVPGEIGVPTPLLFYPGDGTGKLGKEVSLGEIGDGLRLLPGDLNGDGRADLVSFHSERYTFSTHLNRCASGQGLFIYGRVTNQDLPTGISGQTVRLTGSKNTTTETDGQGNYEFSGLAAGGNYTVTVERGGIEFTPSSKSFTNLTTDQVANFTGQRRAVMVSAASYARGEVAKDSLVSIFGIELGLKTEAATSLPLPKTLGGVNVYVDSQLASLLYVSPTQINLHMPPGFQTGPVFIQVVQVGAFLPRTTGIVQVVNVSPALFSANSSGSGAAAGNIVYVIGNTRREETAGICNASGCVTREIDLNAAEEVYLELYGTGFRNYTPPVTAKIGGETAQVTFAGKQSDFVGLDQVNMKIPKSLVARGEVDVVLTVDGKQSNPVRVKIK